MCARARTGERFLPDGAHGTGPVGFGQPAPGLSCRRHPKEWTLPWCGRPAPTRGRAGQPGCWWGSATPGSGRGWPTAPQGPGQPPDLAEGASQVVPLCQYCCPRSASAQALDDFIPLRRRRALNVLSPTAGPGRCAREPARPPAPGVPRWGREVRQVRGRRRRLDGARRLGVAVCGPPASWGRRRTRPPAQRNRGRRGGDSRPGSPGRLLRVLVDLGCRVSGPFG